MLSLLYMSRLGMAINTSYEKFASFEIYIWDKVRK